MDMGAIFRKTADQILLPGEAFGGVGMGFHAAEGIGLLGDGREDQGVGGAKYHQAHHRAQNPFPKTLASFLF
jgi:hypothetical protein